MLVTAATDNQRPTIVKVTPQNDQKNLATDTIVTAQFSEPMDPSTINDQTFTVMQTTTPSGTAATSEHRSRTVKGTVTYSGVTAIFWPDSNGANPLQPSQEFGNVFTATITSDAKDIAGNALTRDYVWSFTTGEAAFSSSSATTQTDQSAPASTPVAPTITTPVVPTQAPVQITSTPALSTWGWLAGILLGAVVIALFSVLAWNASHKKQQVQSKDHRNTRGEKPFTTTAMRVKRFGTLHPVNDIEGIGPTYSARLHAMGIENRKQLWKASAKDIANKVGAQQSTVESWQHMAELSSLKDIGPQYAELLERSGVHTIEELKGYSPKELLALIQAKQDSLNINIQGNALGPNLVANWIEAARESRFDEPREGRTA